MQIDSQNIWRDMVAGTIALLIQFPPSISILLAMMTLDFITALAAAGYRGTVSSDKARRGIHRKVMILAAGVAGHVISNLIPPLVVNGSTLNLNIGSAICGMFSVSEFISILEHVGGREGNRLPRGIRSILNQLKSDEE